MDYLKNHPCYSEISVVADNSINLNLIEPKLKHAKESLRWTSNSEVVRLMGCDFPDPSLDKEVARIKELCNNPNKYSWMIECNRNINGQTVSSKTDKSGARRL